MRGMVILICLASMAWGEGLHAAEELGPGRVLTLTFPDLPPSLHGMNQTPTPVASVSVRLPDDYSPDGSFPLIVFLHGGIGSDGGDLSWPLEIVGKQSFVAANFPLFKTTKNDEAEPWGGVRIGFEDYPVMSRAYVAILRRIHETIPNIDRKRSLLGGYSNGGHATAMMLSALDPNILESFQGFYILDSGIEWTSYPKTESLKRHDILFVVGAGKPKNDDWWRGHLVDRIKYFEAMSREFGMKKWKFVFLDGVGHDTPKKYLPTVREWAYSIRDAPRSGAPGVDSKVGQ
jgi:hypothetical protein